MGNKGSGSSCIYFVDKVSREQSNCAEFTKGLIRLKAC